MTEAVAVDMKSYYEPREVAGMLRKWFRGEEQPTTHGTLTYRPKPHGGTHDRWGSVQVSDRLLEQIDLSRAWRKLPKSYRRVLLLWYGHDMSDTMIVAHHRRMGELSFTKRVLHRRRERGLRMLAELMGPKG